MEFEKQLENGSLCASTNIKDQKLFLEKAKEYSVSKKIRYLQKTMINNYAKTIFFHTF